MFLKAHTPPPALPDLAPTANDCVHTTPVSQALLHTTPVTSTTVTSTRVAALRESVSERVCESKGGGREKENLDIIKWESGDEKRQERRLDTTRRTRLGHMASSRWQTWTSSQLVHLNYSYLMPCLDVMAYLELI